MTPELTVVIPVRNGAGTIGDQLSALAEETWDRPWEILVVENGSTDSTVDVIEAHRPLLTGRLRVIRSTRSGLNCARNLGVEEAGGDRIAIVDADDVVGTGWVAAMGEALDRHGFVTGPLELDRLNPPWLAASRGRTMEENAPTFYGLFPYAHGCNLGLHRDRWSQAGRFDEGVYGAEDIEFSLRMCLAGCPASFTPAAVVHYRYRREPVALWRQGLLYGRCRPLVARKLRDAGCRRPPRLAGWRSWLRLVGLVPEARSAEGRALLAWTAGNRLGHLVGSVEHRTMLL